MSTPTIPYIPSLSTSGGSASNSALQSQLNSVAADVAGIHTQLRTSAVDSLGSTLSLGSSDSTTTLEIGTGAAMKAINVGTGTGQTTINIGGPGDTVAIAGTLTTVNTTNTDVKDNSLTLNKGGTIGSGGNAGIYIEEDSVATPLIRQSVDRTKIQMQPSGASTITLNQSLQTTDAPTFASATLSGKLSAGSALLGSGTAGGFLRLSNGVDSFKRVCLYDRANTGSSGDDQTNVSFYGLGCWLGDGAGEMNYQVPTGANHAWYESKALTGTTGSNQLMKLNNAALTVTPRITAKAGIASPAAIRNTLPYIDTGSNNAIKMISLADYGDASNQAAHDFYGLGMGTAMVRYQVNVPASSHVFYAATSATASNELFRIAGNGAVSMGGSMTVGGTITTGTVTNVGTLTLSQTGTAGGGYYGPTKLTLQNISGCNGASLDCSSSSVDLADLVLTGKTNAGWVRYLGNAAGGGVDGSLTFAVNTKLPGTGAKTLLALSSSGSALTGDLSISGKLTVGGTALPAYEEYMWLTALTGADTTAVLSFQIIKVGRMVTMHSLTQITGTASSNTFTSSTAMPTRFQPQTDLNRAYWTPRYPMTFGWGQTEANGYVSVAPGASNNLSIVSSWSNISYTIYPFSISWTTA